MLEITIIYLSCTLGNANCCQFIFCFILSVPEIIRLTLTLYQRYVPIPLIIIHTSSVYIATIGMIVVDVTHCFDRRPIHCSIR